jgi:hypothetical protein
MELTKGSTPMKPVCGRFLGAMQQVLAAAEADFEHDALGRMPEQACERPGAGFVRSIFQSGNSGSSCSACRGLQRLAAAAAEKRLGRSRAAFAGHFTPRASFSGLTKLVFSQAKDPSRPGLRPKWPYAAVLA